MGTISDGVKLAYDFVEDFIYWRDPEKAVILIKEAILLPLPILIGLYFMPIRVFVILAIWAATLFHSEFFVVLVKVIITKVLELIHPYSKQDFKKIMIQKLKELIMLRKLPFRLPLSELLPNLWKYFKAKLDKIEKSRPRYERSTTFDEIGEERRQGSMIA